MKYKLISNPYNKKIKGGFVSKIPIEPKSEDKKCAPHVKYEDDSCLSYDALKNIIKSYNLHIYLGRIKGNKIDNYEKLSKKEMIAELTKRLDNICNDQICWLQQDFVKELNDKSLDKVFRPKGPQGRFTWLSNFDIEAVMKQYELKYNDFKFLGALPIDFEDLTWLENVPIDFNKLVQNNKYKIGAIINVDYHWQNGSHWVALYTDLNKKQIYYFDSYGIKPNKRIRVFVKKIAKFLKNNYNYDITSESISLMKDKDNHYEKVFDIKYNKNRKQYENSECGVYSINFILRLLKGEDFDYISNNKLPDKEVNKCREYYFRYK